MAPERTGTVLSCARRDDDVGAGDDGRHIRAGRSESVVQNDPDRIRPVRRGRGRTLSYQHAVRHLKPAITYHRGAQLAIAPEEVRWAICRLRATGSWSR